MEFIPMTFDPTDRRPLYQQLYGWLAGEIAAGRLKAGEKLPSKRSAAANLGVSLNTCLLYTSKTKIKRYRREKILCSD